MLSFLIRRKEEKKCQWKSSRTQHFSSQREVKSQEIGENGKVGWHIPTTLGISKVAASHENVVTVYIVY